MQSLYLFIFKFLGLMIATQLYTEDLVFYDMLEYKQKGGTYRGIQWKESLKL
jgi:hypothetical protein